MPEDNSQLYSDIIRGYQQRLSVAIFDVEKIAAQSAEKDRRIAELTELLEDERASR